VTVYGDFLSSYSIAAPLVIIILSYCVYQAAEHSRSHSNNTTYEHFHLLSYPFKKKLAAAGAAAVNLSFYFTIMNYE